VAVEVIPRDELLERDGNGLVKVAGFRWTEHEDLSAVWRNGAATKV
jgi:hypothetical protein